jgi:c-di-GMP-binding flagellar brake protein YcgR
MPVKPGTAPPGIPARAVRNVRQQGGDAPEDRPGRTGPVAQAAQETRMDQEAPATPPVQRSSGIHVELRHDMPVVLQFARDGAKFASRIVGVEPYKFIIAKMPLAPGIRSLLFPGQGLTLRFECDGIIYGFDTEIANFVLKPAPLLILAYPVSTEKIELRRYKRLSCLLPVRLANDFAHSLAFMVDVSRGGCRLVVDKNDIDGVFNVMTGDTVTIHALRELFGGQDLRATIANATQKDHKAILGASFAEDDSEMGRLVERFVGRVSDIMKDQKGG